MIEERRKHPRYPSLVRCTLVFGGERRDTFCTQLGPAAGFLACRTDGMFVGQPVSLEMRPGGVGTPAVVLQGEVVRLVLHGSAWPNGAAVRWKVASCELGIAPLLDFLVQSLRVPGVSHTDFAADRHAEFDLEGHVFGRAPRPRSAARNSDVLALDRVNAAPAKRQGQPSRVVPTGGLLSALAMGGSTSARQTGAAVALGGQAMGRADDLEPMPPLMVRGENSQSDRVGAWRRPPPTPIAVSPSQHAGGPGPEPAQSLQTPPTGPAPRTASAAFYAQLGGPLAPAAETPNPVLSHARPTPVALAAPVMAHRPPFAVASSAFGAPAPVAVAPRPKATEPEPTLLPPPAHPRDDSPEEPQSSSFGWRDAAARSAPVAEAHRPPPTKSRAQRPVTPPPVLDTSHLFMGSNEELSRAVAHSAMAPPTNVPMDGLSQSWPVYALAPGERRENTDPEAPQIPALMAAGKDFDLPGEPTETRPKQPITDNLGQAPAQVPEMAVMRKHRPKNNEVRPMVAATMPVTYDHQGQMGRGMVVAISPQAVAVVTNDSAPNLDDPVVLHLPLRDRDGPVTVHLCGKLLQVSTETEQGPRFVLHIERVEEGHVNGAFLRLLDQLARG